MAFIETGLIFVTFMVHSFCNYTEHYHNIVTNVWNVIVIGLVTDMDLHSDTKELV